MNIENMEAKVKARNQVNEAIMALSPYMRAAVEQFLGQKISKADGTLLKKVAEALPVCPNTPKLFAYYTLGNGYSLRACFRAAVTVTGGGTQYAEADTYLCDVTDGFATKMYPNPTYRKDFTVQEVLGLKRALAAARDTVSNIESQLTAII